MWLYANYGLKVMKRHIILVVAVLLIGGVIYLNRVLSTDRVVEVAEKEEYGYRLNDSLCNAISDLPTMESMERYIKRWMTRYGIKGASLAVMRNEKLIYCKGFGWADEEMEREAENASLTRKTRSVFGDWVNRKFFLIYYPKNAHYFLVLESL